MAVFPRCDASMARSKPLWFVSFRNPSEKMKIDLRPRVPARPRDSRSTAPRTDWMRRLIALYNSFARIPTFPMGAEDGSIFALRQRSVTRSRVRPRRIGLPVTPELDPGDAGATELADPDVSEAEAAPVASS